MARYLEIADDVRARIASGAYPVGSRLPGITALQEQYKVAGMNTVRAAHQVLIREGVLRSEQGLGTFVVARPAPGVPDVAGALRAAREAVDRAIAAWDAYAAATGQPALAVPGPGLTGCSASGEQDDAADQAGAVAPGERPAAAGAATGRSPGVKGWLLVEVGPGEGPDDPVVVISGHASAKAAHAALRLAGRRDTSATYQVRRRDQIRARREWDLDTGRATVRPGPPS